MAETCPFNAARAAQTTASAAALPDLALIFPISKDSKSSKIPSFCSFICSTLSNEYAGLVPISPSKIASILIAPSNESTNPAARCSVATSPTTKQFWVSSGSCMNALTMISGPMPAGSPMVMAMGRTMGAPCTSKVFIYFLLLFKPPSKIRIRSKF